MMTRRSAKTSYALVLQMRVQSDVMKEWWGKDEVNILDHQTSTVLTSRLVLSCRVVCCHIVSCRVVSCVALRCVVLSCVLSCCLALSCFAATHT